MKISAKQYAQALYELTLGKSEQDIDMVVEKFFKKLIKRNQKKIAPKIIEKFKDIYNENSQAVEAQVISAREVVESHSDDIKNFLKEKYRAKDVFLDFKIDKGIKGGIIIRVGDEVLDASISSKLKKMNFLII
jgi:F-type H+-transporting ATPase subunit delta